MTLRVLAALFLIIAGVSALACSTDDEAPGVPVGPGAIFFVGSTSDPETGVLTNEDLWALEVGNGEARPELAVDGISRWEFPWNPPRLPLVVAQSIEGSNLTLVIVESRSKAWLLAREGTAPVTSSDGHVAWCDSDRNDQVNLGGIDGSAIRVDVQNALNRAPGEVGGCPAMTWCNDGDLAALIGRKLLLAVRDAETGTVTEYPLPTNFTGGANITCSANSAQLALEDARGIVIVDRSAGTARRFTAGSLPAHSPVDPRLLAVSRVSHGDDDNTIAIFDGDNIIAESRASETLRGYAWSPDGEWIALIEQFQIRLWHWPSGTLRRMYHAPLNASTAHPSGPAVWVDVDGRSP